MLAAETPTPTRASPSAPRPSNVLGIDLQRLVDGVLSGDTGAPSPETPPAPAAADPVGSGGDDAAPDEAPPPTVFVPPAATPVPRSPEQVQLERVILDQWERARRESAVVALAEQEAVRRVRLLEAQVDGRQAHIAALGDRDRQGAARLDEARARRRGWAVEAYMGGELQRIGFVTGSEGVNDLARRLSFVHGVMASANQAMREHRQARQVLQADIQQLVGELEASRDELAVARQRAIEISTAAAARRMETAALETGRTVAVGGLVLPVAGVNRFTDTFGAPRMTGTRFAHPHQGTDIFAAPGTPVVAFERGVLARVGTDLLGGIKLWLVGQSGTRYYYAHLLAHAPGAVDGLVVEAGQTLGFVGNTGNAVRTPPHLHFEVHPAGSRAVNPYPLLRWITTVAAGGAGAVGAQP